MLALYYGTNQFLSQQELQAATAKYQQINLINADQLQDLNQAFVNSETFSLFPQTNSATVFKRLLKNKNKSLITNFVEHLKIVADSVDFFFWEEGPVDKRSVFFKYLSSAGKLYNFEEMDYRETSKWITSQVKKNQITFEKTLIEKFLAKTGSNLHIVNAELEKLMLYLRAQKRTQVTEEDLAITSISPQEGNIWSLMDAISSKDKAKIMLELDKLLKEVKDFPLLISMIGRQIKILFLVKQTEISRQELISKLKLNPYVLSKASQYAHNFSSEGLKALFEKLLDLDFAIKQGKIDAKLGLNLFLLSI